MSKRKKSILNIIKRTLNYKFLLSILIGAILGYAYYYYIGCSTGSCAISSNPYSSIMYGMLLGGVLAYGKKRNKEEEEKNLES